jgi:uncharacterized protein YjbJ (UPF0337 family)
MIRNVHTLDVCFILQVLKRVLARASRASGHNLLKEASVMNKQEMEGKWDKTKGSVKENVGRAINDREMEAEGQRDKLKGDVKEGFGEARRKVGETIEDVGEDIKR